MFYIISPLAFRLLIALLFRNLDTLTTEESVLSALQGVTSLPIKNIRVAKDPLTNTSRGFCYVELNSTSEAVMLHDQLQNMDTPLYVDKRLGEFLFLGLVLLTQYYLPRGCKSDPVRYFCQTDSV